MKAFGIFENNANLSAIARRYLWTALIVTLLATSISLLEGAGVGLLIPLLSTFTNDLNTTSRGALGIIQRFAQGHTRQDRVLIVSSFILTCMVLKSALQIIANRFASWVDGSVGHDIRCALADRLHRIAYSFYLVEEPARLLNILSSESWKASESIRVVLTRLAEAAGVFVFSVMLLVVSWKLSLIVLIGGFVARLVQKRAEKTLRNLSARTVTVNQVLADRMLFTVFAARLIRLFDSQKSEQVLFTAASDDLRTANLEVENLSGTLGPVLEAMHGLLFILVLLVAVGTGVSLPVLAAFLVLMNRLQPHLRAFEQSGAAFAALVAHFKEVEWMLETRDKPAIVQGHLPFLGLRETIEFKNVTFEYVDREAALKDASFVLHRGRSTALIGGSGAGKSTLIGLLCRLLEPVNGGIFVDGVPLADIRLSEWLNVIAVAGQDIDLIDGTIADNIAYGRRGMERTKVEAAASAAGADFIQDLPHRFETLVGSQGMSLSGGQRQRIGIARALAREPQILILDEATNAVDVETENAILETLQRLPSGTTLILISHRPSTLALCNDAIVIHHGQIVRTGPLASTPEYRSKLLAASEFSRTEEGSAKTFTQGEISAIVH